MKQKAVILSIIMLFFCLCSCKNAPTEQNFTLYIETPQTNVKVGDTVTYTAVLRNNTDDDFTLTHGIPLITVYICSEEQNTEHSSVGMALAQTNLEGNDVIRKQYNAELLEAGRYKLVVYCGFSIENKDFYYRLDDILIEVK